MHSGCMLITRLPVDQFHYRQFRYLNLEDAVAQAKRDGAAVPDTGLPIADADLAEYGISRVSMDYLHYRQYQYTNLKNALAQAKWSEQKKSDVVP